MTLWDKMAKKRDVIIVGGGPAGIFAALELSQAPDLGILFIEKGKDIDERLCPVLDKGSPCILCSPCHLVSGLGGAGAFGDGKLTLSGEVGGRLRDYLRKSDTETLIKYVDDIYLKFGASNKLYGVGDRVDDLCRRASLAELRLKPVPLRHLGTEHCRSVLKAIRDYLMSRLEFKLGVTASTVIVDNGGVRGIETETGERFDCNYLILAPGREGADWLSTEATRLNLTKHTNPIDVGLRVEVPVAVTEELTSVLYEAKLEFVSKSFDDRVRMLGQVKPRSFGG